MALPQLMPRTGMSPFAGQGMATTGSSPGFQLMEQDTLIQLKQLFFMKKMADSLSAIEAAIITGVMFEKNKSASDKMSDLEKDRENTDKKGGGLGEKIAGGVAKLGLKALLAAGLFGVLGGLTDWGNSIKPVIGGFLLQVGKLEDFFTDLGTKVNELIGDENNGLGKFIAMMPLVIGALGAILLVAPKAAITATAKGAGGIVKYLTGTVEKAGTMAKGGSGSKLGNFFKIAGTEGVGKIFEGASGAIAKILPFAKGLMKFMRALPVIGQVLLVLEGIWGTVTGFIKGFQEGGLLEGLKQAVLGGIEGLIGSFVEMIVHIIGYITKALGFESFGEQLKNFKWEKMMDLILVGFGFAIESALHGFGVVIDAIRNGVADQLQMITGWVANLPYTDGLVKTLDAVSDKIRPKEKRGPAPEAPDFDKMISDIYAPDPKEAEKKVAATSDRTAVLAQRESRDAGIREKYGMAAAPSRVSSPSGAIGSVGSSMGNAGSNATTGESRQNSSTGGKVGNLLDLIAKGESGRAGYDAVYSGAMAPPKPVSTMTVGEVKAWQREESARQRRLGKTPSSAAGRYQFIRATLEATQKTAGISDNALFDAKTQDALAISLLDSNKKHGLSAWMAKKTSDGNFINWVASQWASIKNTSGRGSYDGDGLNKGGIDGSQVIAAMNGGASSIASASKPSASAPASASSGPTLAASSSAVSPASMASSGGNKTNINAPTTNVVGRQDGKQSPSSGGALNAVTPPEFASFVT